MSDERKDGGSAFPLPIGPAGDIAYEGMSLRDYFAAKALPTAFRFFDDGYCGPPSDEAPSQTVAKVAYELADAMLKARSA